MKIGFEVFFKGCDLGCGLWKFSDGLEVDDFSSVGAGFVRFGGEELSVGLPGFLAGGEPVAKAGLRDGLEVIVLGKGAAEWIGEPGSGANGLFAFFL